MLHRKTLFIAVFSVASITGYLGGCTKQCPMGTGLLHGECLPVVQGTNTPIAGATAAEQSSDMGLGGTAGAAANANTAPSARTATNAVSTNAGNGASAAAQANRAATGGVGPVGGQTANGASSADAGGCLASEETCDNADNDCDGRVDEDVTRVCGDLPAPCQAGVLSCRAGQWDDEATQCVGAVGPQEEQCDADMIDENCNGIANEGCACAENETRMCGRNEGVCKPGMQACQGGKWTTDCVGAVGDPSDSCECLTGDTESCTAGKGVCAMGERQCERGRWSKCQPAMQPSRETCDNVDNDCDGVVDGTSATCDSPEQRCVSPGRCAECTTDRDCTMKTTGCDVGVCKSGTCSAQPLAEFAACTSGATRGYCVDKQCTAPRQYKIEDTDEGRADGQVEFLSGSWANAGSVRYSSDRGAYFLAHFTGTKVAIYGGKNSDRGKVEYSICGPTGSGCQNASTKDNYAASLEAYQLLWSSPTLKFGEYTVKGRSVDQNTQATDDIIDFDYAQVN